MPLFRTAVCRRAFMARLTTYAAIHGFNRRTAPMVSTIAWCPRRNAGRQKLRAQAVTPLRYLPVARLPDIERLVVKSCERIVMRDTNKRPRLQSFGEALV
jgi:hypothetical protein